MNTALKTYRRSKKGVLTNMYHAQKARNAARGFGKIGYSLEWLHETFLNDPKYDQMYQDWVKSGYTKAKKPSIDRINNKIGYTKDNIHLLTWADNRFKQSMERRSRKGKVAQMLNGEVVKIWHSQREIWRTLGIQQSMISMALTGKCKTAYGFTWKYVSEIIGNIHTATVKE